MKFYKHKDEPYFYQIDNYDIWGVECNGYADDIPVEDLLDLIITGQVIPSTIEEYQSMLDRTKYQ